MLGLVAVVGFALGFAVHRWLSAHYVRAVAFARERAEIEASIATPARASTDAIAATDWTWSWRDLKTGEPISPLDDFPAEERRELSVRVFTESFLGDARYLARRLDDGRGAIDAPLVSGALALCDSVRAELEAIEDAVGNIQTAKGGAVSVVIHRPELIDAEKMHTESPARFDLVPRELRHGLDVGDCAKVCIQQRERVWLDVVARLEDGGRVYYLGTMQADAVTVSPPLAAGDVVRFQPRHVYDVDRGE
jgi:hypothetical protein